MAQIFAFLLTNGVFRDLYFISAKSEQIVKNIFKYKDTF